MQIEEIKNLQIEEKENKKNENKITLKSSCFIDFIEWSPKKDGEIQIDEQDFLMILSGRTSPVAVLSRLSKDNPSFISHIYNNNDVKNDVKAQANSKSAGQDLNDASVNIGRDVNESEINGGSIETEPSVISDQNEEKIPDNIDTNYEESYSEDEQQ